MKKGLLLAGAVFSLGVLVSTAEAVTINLGDKQKIKFGSRAKIYGQYLGDRGVIDQQNNVNDKSDLRFSLNDARIWFKYKFNKYLSAATQFSYRGGGSTLETIDAYFNIRFADEFNIILGLFKVPFERHSGLQSGWTFLFPTGPAYGVRGFFTNPVADRAPRSGSRSPGATVWGNIAGGMFKYYVGVFDGSNEDDTNTLQQTAFAVRVQFTPTMLGYKPEKGYVLKNTYVGKKDVLTIGVSYVSQPYGGNMDDQSSWGVDLMWEQKFGTIAPGFQVGYVNHNNWRGGNQDRTGLLIQGQLLYAQKVWVGKPALVARYMRGKIDQQGNDIEPTVWGAGINYFFKGPANRISLVFDNVDPDRQGQDSYTDVTLAVYFSF